MSSPNQRKLSYALAINEALTQMMQQDQDVFVIGQGIKSPWYVGATCKDLIKNFGEERVIDTPVSENGVTGAAVGAAIAGMKPVVVHPRMDFMIYGLDPIINEAANWHYMYGGKGNVPVVIWPIINRGGEQGPQHSQALQVLFAHVPGLKLVMPATPYDAKGLMVAAIRDKNPVVFIDDRWLYGNIDNVPEETYEVEIGKANILKKGKDLTIISSSYLAIESLKAAHTLAKEKVDIEVLDLRTISPLDETAILSSIKKTGNVLIVDGTWESFGVSAEISALISEQGFHYLKSPISRLALPDAPAPSANTQEESYYIKEADIVSAIRRKLSEKNI